VTTTDQMVFVAATFLIIAAITAAAQFGWLGKGRVGRALTFAAGCAAVLCLRLADLPPSWFDGTWEGFGMAITFLLMAFVSDKGEERSFGRPLLNGMGLVTLGANVVAFVMEHFMP